MFQALSESIKVREYFKICRVDKVYTEKSKVCNL